MGSLLVTGIGQLVTLEGTSRAPVRGVTAAHVLGTLQDAWMLVEDGFISRIGTGRPPPSPGGNRMDVGGRAIIPGFVDCHTHSIFSGWRLDEYELRLKGAGYLEILKAGGGILSTVETTRGATEGDLLDQGQQRLREFALQGTTTVEVKSGYGLDEETEFRMLKVIADLSREGPVETIPTFLGAHAVPLEHRDDPQAYVDHLIISTLPRVAREGMAQFVDVFCEEGAFTPEQSRQILEAASRLGLKGRLHADEMAGGGGAELGVRLGAASVDHLVHVSEEGIRALAESDTIAVVLPGTSFFLGLDRHAPARRLWDEGAALAISTDFNPGSSPIQDMKLAMTLACLNMKLTPAEALVAATINPAHSLDVADRVGSLEVGKQADFVVLEEDDWRHIVYRPGAPLVRSVVKRGSLIS